MIFIFMNPSANISHNQWLNASFAFFAVPISLLCGSVPRWQKSGFNLRENWRPFASQPICVSPVSSVAKKIREIRGFKPKSNRNQTEIKPFLENMFYRFMNPPIRVGPCLSVVQSLQPATFNLQPATCIRGSKSATCHRQHHSSLIFSLDMQPPTLTPSATPLIHSPLFLWADRRHC